jgi:hypothetical protein
MKNVKIIVIVLGLGGAALMLFMNMKKEEPIPDTPDTKTLWMCAACQKSLEWTLKEEVDYSHSAAPPLPCPSCKARELYRAQRCPECDTIFFAADVPNSTGKCPKCNPDLKPPPPPDIEDKEEAPDGSTPDATPVKKKVVAI